MESQRIDGYGGSRSLSDGIPLILRQQPASQLIREIVEIRDKSGLFMLGRLFDHQ